MVTPSLADAIQEFKQARVANVYAGDPGEPDDYSVEELAADSNICEGYCYDVSELFVAFLADRGIEGTIIEAADPSVWGYEYSGRHFGSHFAVDVQGAIIDWTAAQFLGSKAAIPTITKGRV